VINTSAHWIDQDVVVNGIVITARDPDDLPDFCKAFIEILFAD
jgi:protease I